MNHLKEECEHLRKDIVAHQGTIEGQAAELEQCKVISRQSIRTSPSLHLYSCIYMPHILRRQAWMI